MSLLSEIKSAYPNAYEAKQNLSAEFWNRATIRGAVAILYYPVQHGPMSHGELEVEGDCYYFRNLIGLWKLPEPKRYEKRLYKIRRDASFPPELAFVRIGINVTPKQIQEIHSNIDGIRSTIGLTRKISRIDPQIAHRSNRLLMLDAAFGIIPELAFPTLASAYLYQGLQSYWL